MNNKVYICIRKKDNIIIDDKILLLNKKEETKKSYTLLKNILEYLNIPFDVNDIMYTSSGKPYLKNNNIKFNYSHSKNYIAIAVSNDLVGIDIEDEFNISDDARKLYLNGINNNLRKSWVMKEAYCKVIGDFTDEYFKNLDIDKINEQKYVISNYDYDVVLFFKGKKKIELL